MKVKAQMGSWMNTDAARAICGAGTKPGSLRMPSGCGWSPRHPTTRLPNLKKSSIPLLVVLGALILQLSATASAQVAFTLVEDTRRIQTGQAIDVEAGFGQPFNESLDHPYLYFDQTLANQKVTQNSSVTSGKLTGTSTAS